MKTMRRRTFSKLAGLGAVAISTTGFIKFNGTSYEGNCETTSDILGPFYRPDSPETNNLVIEGAQGEIVKLSGTIRHKDCTTPYEGAKVELWHCSADEIYDNESDEFRYRGTTYCDANGNYHFTTQMPVPYDVGGGSYRPAHFHLMISAPGYQSLITQIYFVGDPYLEKDAYSASAEEQGRVRTVRETKGIKMISFDANMNDKLLASSSALDQIIGVYKSDKGKSKEFFKKDKLLWMKNEVFGRSYEYVGNNEFQYAGLPSGMVEKLHFDLQKPGKIKLTYISVGEDGQKRVREYSKG